MRMGTGKGSVRTWIYKARCNFSVIRIRQNLLVPKPYKIFSKLVANLPYKFKIISCLYKVNVSQKRKRLLLLK
jgi:hypothetical protein